MTLESHNRINWIDMAKGYGIILVIWAHLQDEGLRSWIYSFHMPLFFFLSGYVFTTKYCFKDFIKRKYKSIIIPYFCLGIPMVLFQAFGDTLKGADLVTRIIFYAKAIIVQKRLWTLWYISCLFLLNILFYILVTRLKKDWALSFVVIILPIIGILYYEHGGTALLWNLDVCFTAIPFFYIGYLFKKNEQFTVTIYNTQWKKLLVTLLLISVNIICWKLSLDSSDIGLEMFYCKYGNAIYTYLAAFAGIFCIVIISKEFILPPIKYLGENSMLYYAWHQTIMIPITTKATALCGLDVLLELGTVGLVFYKIIIMLVILITLTILNMIITTSRFKFILGK